MTLRRALFSGVLALAIVLPVPAGADVIGEGVSALRCAEDADVSIPKRLEFMQAVLTDDFESYDRVALFVVAEYADAIDVNRGQIIATVFLIKADETQSKIGKVKAKIRDGEVEKLKLFDANIEQGDFLHWKVKTKRMEKLSAEFEDCINFYFTLAVADEAPA